MLNQEVESFGDYFLNSTVCQFINLWECSKAKLNFTFSAMGGLLTAVQGYLPLKPSLLSIYNNLDTKRIRCAGGKYFKRTCLSISCVNRLGEMPLRNPISSKLDIHKSDPGIYIYTQTSLDWELNMLNLNLNLLKTYKKVMIKTINSLISSQWKVKQLR